MHICGKCRKPISNVGRLERHVHTVGGMNVELMESAIAVKCDACGESAIVIPNLKGLSAAVAIARVQEPVKLNGREIRFLRKALGFTGKELAQRIGVTPESVSRWEADKLAIAPQNEMLLRVFVASIMKDLAPAMDVRIEDIVSLKISPIRNGFDDHPMQFEIVRLKDQGKKEPHWDTKLAA